MIQQMEVFSNWILGLLLLYKSLSLSHADLYGRQGDEEGRKILSGENDKNC